MDRKDIYLKADELVSAMTNVNVQSNGLKDKAEIEKVKEENEKAVEKMLLEHGIEPEKQLKVAEEIKDEAPKKNFVQKIWGKIKSAFSAIKKASKVIWDFLLSFFKNKLVIISLIFVLFYSMWEDVIDNSLIKLFFAHFERNIVSDIIFYLLSIGCIINTLCSKPKRYDKLDFIISSIIIPLAFWGYVRFSDKFNIYSLATIEMLKYIDIVVVFSVCNIFRCFTKNLKEANYVFKDGFDSDVPIESDADDLFQRKNLAKDSVEKLLNTDTSKGAFTFGIVSPWGYGKSSFMNLMRQKIKEKYQNECLVIEFNPWTYAYNDNTNIISLFFNELRSHLKQYDNVLSRQLIDYSKALSSIGTPETKIASVVIDYITPPSKLDDKINAIKTSITNIGKKIIIFVDDIDRLEKDEIMEVLKLIRNTSNFPYIYFIVAYDKEYMLTVLPNGDKYIEKIFQVEFPLPSIEINAIKNSLIDSLSRIVAKDEIDELKKDIKNNSQIIEDSIFTIRDVKRIVNSFFTSYSRLKGEIDSSDLFILEILKTKYPSVYSILESDRAKILKPSSYDCYELFDENKIDQNNIYDALSNVGRYNIVKYINNNETKLHIHASDKEKIGNILSRLFPAATTYKSNKSINNIFYIDRYFNIGLLESDLSDVEFDKLMRNENINEITSQFEKWSTNKSNSLAAKLKQFNTDNKKEQKKYIKLLLFVLSIMPFDVHFVTAQINKLKELNENHLLSNEDKKFIKDALCENGYSEGLGKYLYSIVFTEDSWDYPLSRKELNEVRHVIFKSCIETNGNDVEAVIYGYNYTNDYSWNNEGNRKYLHIPGNVALLKEYAESHFVDFIKYTINSNPQPYSENEFIINNLPLILWGTWDQFKSYVEGLKDDNPIIKEYKEFVKKCSEKGFKEHIAFNFEHINLNNLWRKSHS